MKTILSILAVGLLPGLVAHDATAQPADNPHPAPTASSSPHLPASPPGVQRLEIKPDTPAERAAFLARRRATLERQNIEIVAPLPAQRIAPPPSPASQQR